MTYGMLRLELKPRKDYFFGMASEMSEMKNIPMY
jgi:hypothetical protein